MNNEAPQIMSSWDGVERRQPSVRDLEIEGRLVRIETALETMNEKLTTVSEDLAKLEKNNSFLKGWVASFGLMFGLIGTGIGFFLKSFFTGGQ